MKDLFDNEIPTKPIEHISGYRIYAPKQKRRTLINNLPELYPDLPNEKFDIIYADPPWDYGGKMQFDRSSKKTENLNWEKDIFISAANFKYPTIKTNDMMKIPIGDIANDNCLLFMWVTNPHLAQGIELGKFVSGLLGTGGAIQIDKDGNSFAEFDYLTIRKVATFFSIIVQEMKHVGGAFVVSPSGMTCSKVEEMDECYRCYFDKKDGEKEIHNQFTVGQQARRQTFNLTNQAYYWRLVTGVGDDYIDLSKTDCDTGSTVPQAGDEIVGLGHRTDKTRQAAIIISAYGTDSPSIKYYQGIDSYSLVDKAIRMDYYDPVTGRFKSVTYGDTYIGARDGSNFLSYNQDDGLKVKGQVQIEAGSTGAINLKDLPDEIYKSVKVGGENLLKNTAFRGDYQSLELKSSTALKSFTDLYSPKLTGWSGDASIIENEEEDGVYPCKIGNIEQEVQLIPEENYMFTVFASGNNIVIECGGNTLSQALTRERVKYTFSFVYHSGNSFAIKGDATIKKPKLERGTIAGDWCPNVNDEPEITDRFKHLWYIQDSIKEAQTDIYGGLILTQLMQLGEFADGVMKKVTAGISGIYNDNTDVAVWTGGSYEDAIRTVQTLLANPNYQPSDEEWKSMAKFVATHGGDTFIRGFIYALGGVFRGRVETSINGKRIVIDPDNQSLKMYNENGKICAEMVFGDGIGGISISSVNLYEYDNLNNLLFYSSMSGRRIAMVDGTNQGTLVVQPDQIEISSIDGNDKTKITKGNLQMTSSGYSLLLSPFLTFFYNNKEVNEGYTGEVLVKDAELAQDKLYMKFKNGIMVGTRNGN